MRRRPSLIVSLLLGLVCFGAFGSAADAQRVKPNKVTAKAQPARNAAVRAEARNVAAKPNRGIQTDLKLKTVVHQGKEYLQTFRVTSKSGLQRITNGTDPFRFFGGGGQYGEALYLFANRADATKFSKCLVCDTKRSVLTEILLPKEMFHSVKKSLVEPTHDWGKNADTFRPLRLNSHILFGKWSPSPQLNEPQFAPMNGTFQLAIRQLGNPSILNQAVIREAN
tara:strand:+ start:625 stop:1296 length:672 start_codon:yes stop_codon:yes gene_type:complete